MLSAIVLVVLGIFAVAIALIFAFGDGSKETPSEADSKAAKAALAKTDAHEETDFRKSATLSGIPWVNEWLLKFELAPRLRILLYQANLKWTTGGLLTGCVICFALPAYLVFWRTGVLIIALAVGAAMGFAPFGFVLFKRGKRFAKFEEGLPEALDLMVSALRAGHSFNAALGLVSRECSDPIGGEFRICFDEQNYGLELRAAIENMMVRVPLGDLRIATTAILIQKETGGNLAEVLNKTSEVIRERFRLRRQVRVHTAHGRITGWVIALLPIFLLIAISILNYPLESLLWKREIGIKLLYGTGISMVFGGLWIRQIINMEV
jgi:tight adherence protein B